ncbi:unnamed protein product [Protopolystoma xenopodis]|uniref:Peptidase C2 calpain domain-containing protein n=1 Tax=Protopolystoma xenopodis TaxID=117903 RepID=A0A3S5BQX0_9PLAT|nr:unnamed protein product [Protopolystoma xenopodis]
MAFPDFRHYFTRLELCHLGPESDTLSSPSPNRTKRRWEMAKHEGEWLRNATAGGCRNFIDTFHLNPQFHVHVEDPDESDDEHMGTLIIGLMQKDMREQRREPYVIGYSIYKVMK